VDDLKTEVLLKGVKVAVAVKQGMAVQEAKACDEAVNCLADGMAAPSEETIVLRGNYREFFASGWKDGEPGEFAPDTPEGGFLPDALQDCAQDEVGKSERLSLELAVEPVGVWIHCSAEVVDPDSGVDDGHGSELFLRAAQAGFFQVALPPYFAAKAAEGCLGMGLHKKSQSGVDNGSLGASASAAHCLMDELIVDFDVGSHGFPYV
jgi:hypothetical protein